MKIYPLILTSLLALSACKNAETVPEEQKEELADNGSGTVQTTVGPLELPAPFASESVTKQSNVIAWPEGKTPVAPEGFEVTRFADNLQHPRRSVI